MKVLSLFSGCGGLDLGFSFEGFELVAAYDHWAPAVACHNHNKHLLGGIAHKKSLALADDEIQLNELPNVDVILGGPPCQGYSFAGKQKLDDPRNTLYLDFKRIVEHVSPRVFLMENVRGLEKMALENIQKSFEKINYQVTVLRADCTLLGLAQRRERVIIVGTKVGDKKFTPPHELIGGLFGGGEASSILSVIKDLPKPTSGKGESLTSKNYLDDHKFLPFSALESRFIPHISNGGCFRDAPRETLPERLQKIVDNPKRYKNPRLFPKADPHKPSQTIPASTSPSIGGVIAPDLEYGSSGFAEPIIPSDYFDNGYYTSPVKSRRFTPREAARLQGFPDDFLFLGSISTKTKLIGNAVPVPLGRILAREIKEQFFS